MINTTQKQALIDAALAVREQSYSPYSHFKVGAALLMDDGLIIAGTNVENLSYGLAICAERGAVMSAVAQGKRHFVACAVATASKEPAFPCGACRQVLAEFNPDLPLILVNNKGRVEETTLSAIFPSQFSKEQLESGKNS